MFPSICVSSSCAEGESRARESLSDGEYELIKNEKQEYKSDETFHVLGTLG